MQNRLNSPVVWVSILAQVCMVITIINPEISEQVKIVGSAVLEILTILGILNNPTQSDKF